VLARIPHLDRDIDADGYVILEAFLERRSVDQLRPHIDAELARPPMPGCERPHNRLVPLRWNNPIVDLILGDDRRRTLLRRVTAGDDLRWISAYVSVKEPGTPALWWHQDWWCWDHPVSFCRQAAQVALLVYLSDTTEYTGALRVLPRSHRRSVPLHRVLPEAHAKEADVPLRHPALRDAPGQQSVCVRAGDAVVLDYRLLHGTHPNASLNRRNAILLSFTPCWRGLPTDVRAHLIQHPALPSGDEPVSSMTWSYELLPTFNGPRTDLPTNRRPPLRFVCGE
jgi:hypothetical protein